MTLLSAGALALLALSLPLVLLHLRRRPPTTVEVDSLREWRRLPAAAPSGRGRFSPPPLPLLLLLQLLALAALVFALAKPAGGGESAPSVRTYVVDESLWMGAREAGGESRIESARALLGRRLAALPADQRVALVAAGTSASIVYEGDADGARAALGDLRVGAGQGDLDAGLRLAAGLRGAASDPVLLLRAAENAAPRVSGDGGAFAEAVVGETGLEDLGVTSGFACDPTDPERCEGLARVRNAGAGTATARLRIETGGGEAIERRLEVGSGEAVPVRFPLAPGQSAEARLLGRDALAVDDSAAVAVPARAGLRVTLVGDPERALPLARALAAVPGVKLRLRTKQSFKPSDPRTSDLLVLDEFLPNGALPRAPALLLVEPPRLPGGAVDTDALGDSRLSGEAEGDPLLAGVDLAALTIDAGAAEQVELPAWMRAIAWSAEGPLLAAGTDAGRRVAMLAFQPSESNLPGLPGFAPLVANIAAWGAEWAPAAALAGETVALDAPDAEAVTLRGPGGERSLAVGDGLATVTLSTPGLYTLTEPRPGGARSRTLAVGAGAEPAPAAPVAVDLSLLAAGPGGDGTEWWPWLLAAAVLLLAAESAYALRREPAARGREASPARRAATALAGLSLVLAALAVVLSETSEETHPATVVADRSDSIGAVAADVQRPWLDAAGECGAQSCPTVQFGGAAALTAPGGEPLPARGGAPLAGAETDLRGALELGLARTPRGGRLDLLSDGYETSGEAEAAGAEARRRGIVINPVPLEERPRDAAVTRVELPPALHAGDPFSLQVDVRSSVATTATLTVSRDGTEVGSDELRLGSGDNPYLFSLRAPDGGSFVYTAKVEIDGDEVPGNDELGAALRVASAPRVMVAGAGAARITPMLEADGIEVESVAPGSLPISADEYTDTDAVVLEDVSAGELGDQRAAALAAAVREDALGLLVLGGPHSFSLGRYYRSPLEAALPVHSLVPGKLKRRRLALELILDRSGSMLDAVDGVPKFEMAQAAARGALRFVAQRQAELGIIAFDAKAKTWVPLTTVEDAATASAIKAKINQLLPEGGTDIYKGLEAGVAAIERSKAKERHIILLSDGVSEAGNFRRLVPRLKAQKITVATVALGNEADTKLLGEIAKATGGNAYVTESPQELPRIFSKEARLNARPVRVRGSIAVEPGAPSPIVASVLGERLPNLQENVVTTTKPGAEAALLGEDTGGRDPDPVLAQWTYGAGRVATWTPGLEPRAAGVWVQRQRFFQDAARWVERGVAPSPLTPEARPGNLGELVVASGEDAEQPPGGELAGTLRTPDDKTIELRFELRAPGEYVAATPRLAPGEYGYAVTDGARTTSGQLAVPYPAELRPGNPEATRLGALAAATGGELSAPDDSGTIAAGGTETWWWAALAALLAFFAGAVLRLLGGRRRPARRTRNNVPLHEPRPSDRQPERV